MGFMLAGLLQGAGAGFSQLAAQRREDALISLRRQYQQEDTAASNLREDAKEERDAKLKVGLLAFADESKRREGETEREHEIRMEKLKSDLQAGREASKAKIDVSMEVLKSKLDRLETAEAKKLEAQLASGDVKDIRAAEDGSMLVTYKNGTTEKRGTKLRDTRARGEEDAAGTPDIAAAARARQGGTPAAKPVKAKPAPQRKWTVQNGVYVIGTEADAEAFTSDPANKGKVFRINGRKYTVN